MAKAPKKTTAAKLTLKQEKFCLTYLETGNASEAYRTAYNTKSMKPATINRQAKALMDNGKIAARIEQLKKPILKKFDVTFERVVQEAAMVAMVDPGDFYDDDDNLLPIKEMPEHVRRALSGFKVDTTRRRPKGKGDGCQDDEVTVTKEVKWHNKDSALKLLAQLSGFIVDKKEHSGPGGGPILTKEVKGLTRDELMEIARSEK